MDDLAKITDEEKAVAAAAHALSVLGFAGWAPLIIFLIYKDKSAFVKFHALQATVFQLGVTVAVIALGIITCGVATVLLIPWLLFECWMAWEAFNGHWTGYPGMDQMFRE